MIVDELDKLPDGKLFKVAVNGEVGDNGNQGYSLSPCKCMYMAVGPKRDWVKGGQIRPVHVVEQCDAQLYEHNHYEYSGVTGTCLGAYTFVAFSNDPLAESLAEAFGGFHV